MKKNIELLAPAGSKDAAFAAIEYGADAIYLGLPRFSARAEAVNFTEDEFHDTVGYAHSCKRKVYVTLNTLIKEAELDEVLPLLQIIEDTGTDAVIVQDFGIIHLLRRYFPSVRLHASTQMAIHNRPAAEYLRQLGVSRVTLARELSIREIAEITGSCGIETESFLHGALCYSYSGLCMYSSMQSGRSANRGRCAYSCRELFSCTELGLQGHAFSLRDLSLAGHIPALLATGVNSLKIEGRKKSALYVAAVVRLYRGIIDQTSSAAEINAQERDLKTIFSRETTDFFVDDSKVQNGRSSGIDTQAVGHRGCLIGSIEAISTHGRNKRLNFTTTEDFEKHDGIQIDIKNSERPFGFPVNELFSIGAEGGYIPVFQVESGNKVAVTLPPETPSLPPHSPVYLASSQRVKRELHWKTPKPGSSGRRYPIAVTITLTPGSLSLSAVITAPELSSIAHSITDINDTRLSPAKNPEQSETAAFKIFSKTGETPFILEQLVFNDPHKLFVPASQLNQLRRELYSVLSEKLKAQKTHYINIIQKELRDDYSQNTRDEYPTEWIIKTDTPLSLCGISREQTERIAEVIIEINENTNAGLLCDELEKIHDLFSGSVLRIALPAICRNSRLNSITRTIEHAATSGINCWQISNLWGLPILRDFPVSNISAAATCYTFNHASITEQFKMGISWSTLGIEDEMHNIQRLITLAGNRLCLTVFQDTPLFIGEACSYSSFKGGCPEDCREINQHREWQDTRGNRFILNKKGCRSYLINAEPFSLAGHLNRFDRIRPRYFQADFINRSYSGADIEQILTALFADTAISNTHTGNFLRTLQ